MNQPPRTRRVFDPSLLKSARERAGMTQHELSTRLVEREVSTGVQREMIWQWENGARIPRAVALANMADILGVSLDSFFRQEEVA
ncbi:helix-turn-helix domain-containing protein [bacterium]|nr:helix-turn-helix domain-containing protein [bacterium]